MLLASLRISLRRTGQNLRLTLAVFFGIVLAVAIVATTVVYFEALRDVALARSLERVEPTSLDVFVKADQTPVRAAEDEQLRETIEDVVLNRLNRYSADDHFALQSLTFLINEPPPLVPLGECPCRPSGIASGEDDVPGVGADGQPDPRGLGALLACDCRRITFMTVPDFEDSVRVAQGAMPVETLEPAPPGESMTIEGLLDAQAAAAFGLSVGDTIPAAPFWESPREDVKVRVSGIYERADPEARFWEIHDQEFTDRTESLMFARFLISEDTFLSGLGPYFPNLGARYVWLVDTDPDQIHATDTGTVRGALQDGDRILQPELDGFRITTDLGNRLADFEVDLFFNRIPMLIVLALVAAVSLYYAAMVASALLATQRSEIALMRSRGATRPQIFAVYTIEASVVAILALVLGPIISMSVVSVIGVVPVFEDLNSGAALPVQFTRNVFLASALGAAFGMLTLLVPAFRATGLTVLAERRGRGRPGRLNVIQRYYLDLGMLGLVAALFWQLSRQGSFVATDVFGETSVNNLTLAVPALLLLMAGVALLRLFPVIADGVARLLGTDVGSRFVPSAMFLGIRQLSRNPAGQARLSLLLVLVSALGVFAATFASTLERSANEQVLYETGAEFRATNVTHRSGGLSVSAEQELLELEGLETVAPVLRTSGITDALAVSEAERFDVLGVDTRNLGDVAWHRSDFFGESMSEFLEDIRPAVLPGIPLLSDSRFVSARVKSLVRRADVIVIARMSDRNGRYYSIPLGNLAPSATDRNRFNCLPPDPNVEPDWCRLGSSIFPPPTPGVATLAPVMPVTLHSIGVFSNDGGLSAGTILIDDIAVLNNIGENLTTIEGFDDLSGLRTLEPTADSLADSITFERSPDGEFLQGIAELRWTDASPGEYRGLAFGREEPTVPAIVSESLAESQGAGIGDVITTDVEGVRVRFEIVRTVVSFPTVNNDVRPFLIADLELLKQRLNLERLGNDIQPDEYWLDTLPLPADSEEPPLSADDIKVVLGEPGGGNPFTLSSGPVIDQKAEVAGVSLDPLVTTGWQALLVIAFSSVLIVSAAGYTVHARTSFIQRRSEMALLRTMGISRGQVILFIAVEQILVISIAVAIGLFLGSRLGDTIFPFLAASGRLGAVAPPMVVQFDFRELALVFGVMAAVILTVMAFVIWSASRTAIHSVMRAGDT